MKRKLWIILIPALLLALCCAPAGPARAATHEHFFGQSMRTAEPTCTENGSITYFCNCGETKTEIIPALGHRVEILPGQPATCDRNGLTEGRRCTVCGAVLQAQAPIPAYGHNWGPWQEGKLPTCEEKGKNYSVCSTCGATRYRDDIEPLGHDWDEGVVTVPAGWLEPGVKTVTCARCGAVRTEEIPVNAPMDGGSIMDQFRNVTPEKANISLQHKDLPLMIVTQPAGGKISPDGETMLLFVEAAGGTEPYTYQWYQYVDFYEKENRPLGQARGDNSPEFPVEKPGKYYCKVTDSAGIPAVEYSEVVEVTSELYIAVQPKNTSTADGVLSCRAEGGVSFSEIYDYPYVYWWFDSEGSLVHEGPDFPVQQPGEYYCHVEDSMLDTVDSVTALVYEADPFEAAVQEDMVYLRLDEEYELRAEVYGGIAPYTGVWTQGGEELPTQQEGDVFTSGIVLYDYNMVDYYTFVATDAMGDTASVTVRTNYRPLEIAQQPKGGMLAKDGKTPVELNVVMAEGIAPFTYYLYQDGTPKEYGPGGGMSGGFKVWEPGEYYIAISDANFDTATSDIVSVTEYEFSIEDVAVSGAIGDGQKEVTMTAKVAGGKAPVTFRWTNVLTGAVLPSEGPECVTGMPGAYTCEAVDAAETRAVFEGIEVDYTGEVPVITLQPVSVVLPYSDTADYHTQLTCLAASGSPRTPHHTPIGYTWEYQKDVSSAWQYNPEQGPTIPVTKIGRYRCICRDTYNGKKVVSNEVTVSPELIYVRGRYFETGPMINSAQFSFYFAGGIPPYRVEIFAINPAQPGGSPSDVSLETFTARHSVEIAPVIKTLPKRRLIPAKGDSDTYGWQPVTATYYAVVSDAGGQRVKSDPITAK